MRLEGDIVFYALGTGEYDELNCKCEISAVSAMRARKFHRISLDASSCITVLLNGVMLLAVAETIRAISLGLRDTLKKPTEAALFDNYGRLCMVVDEVINEVSKRLQLCIESAALTLHLQFVSFCDTCRVF